MNQLAVRNYRHEKKIFNEEDFSSLPTLILILNEVLTGESDLTMEGKKFIENRYDYLDLANKIAQHGGLIELKNGRDISAIEKAIRNITPMETYNFIQEEEV